jgi:Uncharacterized conserved protein
MKSIQEIVKNTIIIKKSEFITTLIPCSDINQVKELIQQHSYDDASHNCYAYIIGNNEKASDDGEPSQTAGLPMLNVLQKQHLNNIIAVVTRYFGGIKLGAGGLTRAYSQSVAEAVKVAHIVETEPVALYNISIDYHFIKKFEHLVKMNNIKCIHTEYNEKVSYQCYIKNDDFISQIQDLTSNQFECKKLRIDYIEKIDKSSNN